jgi:DedD protein
VNAYNDFWVQAGSFTAKVRAENVKETLASKGITSIIENRDVNGATFFRVRIGPYTSQNEADHWLALIKSIKGFEDSQIWQSPSVR